MTSGETIYFNLKRQEFAATGRFGISTLLLACIACTYHPNAMRTTSCTTEGHGGMPPLPR